MVSDEFEVNDSIQYIVLSTSDFMLNLSRSFIRPLRSIHSTKVSKEQTEWERKEEKKSDERILFCRCLMANE